MDDQTFYRTLAKAFMQSFKEDAMFVAEGLADLGVEDVDAFIERATALAAEVETA